MTLTMTKPINHTFPWDKVDYKDKYEFDALKSEEILLISTLNDLDNMLELSYTKYEDAVYDSKREEVTYVIEEDLNDLFIQDINEKITSLKFPEKWKCEKVIPPSVECKNLAKKIISHLFYEYNIIPEWFAPSKEEGVFVLYKNRSTLKMLSIEIYNDLDVVALIKNYYKKEIIISTEIKELDFSGLYNEYTKH